MYAGSRVHSTGTHSEVLSRKDKSTPPATVNTRVCFGCLSSMERSLMEDHPLRIGLQPLPWQTTAKFLGVTLDRRLTFSRHIDNVTRAARAAMAVLYPLITRSSKLSTPIKVRLAAAYVRPILTYAAPSQRGRALQATPICSDSK